jgi:DNA repair exonuclease SbcCD ATPase subunit
MILQFDQLTIQDFKSFRGEHFFNFTNIGAGTHFICGRNEVEINLGANGSGKTSLSDSLTWVLFGQTLSGLRNPDLQPWEIKGHTKVSIQFGIDNLSHVVTRTIAPNSLTLDDKTISQEDLSALLHLSLPVFGHTILLGQGQPLFFDLLPREKLQLLSDTLNLTRWDEYSKKASDRREIIQKDLNQIDGKTFGLDAQEKSLKEMVVRAQDEADLWQQQHDRITKDAERQLAAWRKECEATERNLGLADVAYDGAQTELKSCLKKVKDVELYLTELMRRRQSQIVEITTMENNKERLKEELRSLGKTGSCPTCGQSIKGTGLEKHKKKLTNDIEIIQSSLDKGLSPDLEKQIKHKDIEVKNLWSIQIAMQKVSDKSLYDVDSLTPRVAQLKTQIEVLDRDWEQREQTTNPHQMQIVDLNKRLAQIRSSRKKLLENQRDLEQELKRVVFWVKGFKNVRLYLIEDMLQQLEMATNSMLPEVGLEEWQVQYRIEKETKSGSIRQGLDVVIFSPANDGPVKWESFSGGEGQRLRLVGALALSETLLNHSGVVTNLEIIDEGSSHLSKEGVRDLCSFLAERARTHNKQIFLVDHAAVESAEFTSTITIVKDKNGSRINTN